MSELVYSIKQIFNVGAKGALTDNKASFYYIAPYQRGYKWESNSSYAQVPQMLIDIYEAFVYGTTEYFLQYITVKKLKLDDKNEVLEVIDGQQRLTTLSLLLSRIAMKDSHLENISRNRLQYFRYEGDIFASLLIPDSAEEDENIIHQDQYYMVKAVRTIDNFLQLLEKNDKLKAYYDYLLDSVKLIFNLEDENTNSEEVFENLNNNKVPLTNQYLIKGLLLTKAVNRTTSFNRTLSYKEILDQRTIMGRVWDEINAWITQPEIAHFFFATKKKENPNGIEKLLEVVLRRIENTQTDTREIEDSFLQQYRQSFDTQSRNVRPSMYELFNKFNRIIRDEKTAFDVLNLIKHAYRALYNIWYGDIDFYNLFGYVRFAKTQQYNISWTDEVIWEDRAVVKKKLAKRVLEIIPDLEHSQIEYGYKENSGKLTNLLLSFNVFLEQEEKFDFYQYDHENWTLEHLSPQTPKGDIKIPHNLVSYVLGKLPESLEQSKRTEIETKLLNGEAISVDDLPFLYDSEIDEKKHIMGNMALLGGGDNSAVSNNPFIVKRNIIISRRNKGSFVPYHTIALYEKSLDMKGEKGFTPDLFRWDINDIAVHEQWMRQRNKEIIEQLKKHLA